jgi:aminoglycoside phosphotransferase (APT) family kinase protein
MSSPTQRILDAAQVGALVYVSFGAGVTVTECAELTGGGFAAVWRVRLDDDRQVVLKVAPPPAVGLLEYEQGLIAAEAGYFRLVRSRVAGVPVPEVLHYGTDDSVFDGEWLFTSLLPGTSLPEWQHEHPGADVAPVRRELGAAIARLHTVHGPRFGYSGQRPHGSTWSAAFLAIVDSLLADAASWDVELPSSPQQVRELVISNADALDLVDRPTLVHFDLWDGNVLASVDASGGTRLTGLVDGERYLFGDALMDFVSPVLFRRIEDEPEHPFLRGYADATGTRLTLDAPTRRRLALYRMHLYLLMTVEMPSRGITNRTDPGRRELLAKLLDEEFIELGRPS